jgi:hypothetical protein
MEAKTKERQEARKLRRGGWSFSRILSKVSASKSSISAWVRDIKLTDSQKTKLMKDGATVWGEKWREKWRNKRRSYQEAGKQQAKQGDLLHMAGCMLYWAEGSKCRNSVRFVNSDINMMRLFVMFLRRCYQVKASEITLKVSCYLDHGLSLRNIENWWLKELGLANASLRKGTVVKPRKKHKRKKLKYGVCTVRVNKTEIIQSIYGAIQEYGGFQDNRWLDVPP